MYQMLAMVGWTSAPFLPFLNVPTLILSGDRLLRDLSAHADADIAVFDAYMAALKLPKATEADKAKVAAAACSVKPPRPDIKAEYP